MYKLFVGVGVGVGVRVRSGLVLCVFAAGDDVWNVWRRGSGWGGRVDRGGREGSSGKLSCFEPYSSKLPVQYRRHSSDLPRVMCRVAKAI